MSKIKYSIIVCAYNEEQYLEKCLSSILSQNFDKEAYELIIVDNKSKDKTPEIATSFLKDENQAVRIKYFRIEHVGLSSSRNFAISQSSGEVIIFIDGDAVADSDLLKEYEISFNNESCDFSGGRINLLNHKSSFANTLQNTKYKQIFTGARKKNFFHGANMAFRKYIFDDYQFIENFYSRGDDSSFYIVISNKYNYVPSDKAIVYHERPEKILEWINITITEMSLSYKVATLVEQYTGRKEISFFKSILSNLLIFISFLLILLNPFFLILAIVCILRFKRQNFYTYSRLIDFFFALLLIVIQVIFLPVGFIISYFKYRGEVLVTPVDIILLVQLESK